MEPDTTQSAPAQPGGEDQSEGKDYTSIILIVGGILSAIAFIAFFATYRFPEGSGTKPAVKPRVISAPGRTSSTPPASAMTPPASAATIGAASTKLP